MSLKEQWQQESRHVRRFKNIFAFMDFCYRCKITPENSETEYDEEENVMYLKYPNVTQLW